MKYRNYNMQDLYPIIAGLAEKYTSGDSSAVTYERVRQLMGAVIYCMEEYEKGQSSISASSDQRQNCPLFENKQNTRIIPEQEIPAQTAYERGCQMLLDKINRTRRQYNSLVTEFEAYGNQNYHDTVRKAIPAFFRYYDAQFAPQETIITMDYPVLISLNRESGIDAIEKYVYCIFLEQKFLKNLPENYIRTILFTFRKDYKNRLFNISSVILRSLLGSLMTGKKLDTQADAEDYENLAFQVSEWSRDELKDCLTGLLGRLIRDKYEDDTELFEYLAEDLKDFATELKNAAEQHQLRRVVVF